MADVEALKSDLRGIETLFVAFIAAPAGMLKSDLRGIETQVQIWVRMVEKLVKIRP